MWTWLNLEYFKCFESLRLPLAPLTLLSGANASGKSTVLQALGLLHQTAIDSEWSRALLLDGSLMCLGTVADVIDKIAGRNTLSIGIEDDTLSCRWTALAEERDALSIPFSSIAWRDKHNSLRIERDELLERPIHHLLPDDWRQKVPGADLLSRRIRDFVYISAERLGPRETYDLSEATRFRTVGVRGERTAGLLHVLRDEALHLSSLENGDMPPTLPRQVEGWMGKFFPGAAFLVEPVPRANLVTLSLRTSVSTDFHRAQNVGYGLTHILPIITASLACRSGDVLAVENPEVHLHPAGQALMGAFLAKVASAGAQIILETHSDHVLNGIRRAVRDAVLTPDKVAIHFFSARQEDANGTPQVVSPTIDSKGNIDRWPSGFFDQYDKDLAVLGGWDV